MRPAFLLMGALLAAAGARADQVFLKNGDVLTGTDCSVRDGKVHLATGYSDPVAIVLEQVEKIQFEKPVRVAFTDDIVIETSLLEASAENFSRISSANLPPASPLSFSASLGYGMSNGNSNQSSLLAVLEAGYLFSDTARLSFGGLYEYANEQKEDEAKAETANNGAAQLKADFFVVGDAYLFALGRYSFDRMKDLERRLEESAGLGYDVLREDYGHLSSEVGVSYIDSKYEGPVKDHGVYLRLAENGEWMISSVITFSESVAYRPKFDDFRDYLIDAEAALKFSLIANLYLGFNVIDRYDSSPVAGKKPNDVSLYVSLGYSL